MLYFQITRLALILWSMLMITLIESVGISTKGRVELEHTNKETYAEVLTLAVVSFLGDASLKVWKSRREKGKV